MCWIEYVNLLPEPDVGDTAYSLGPWLPGEGLVGLSPSLPGHRAFRVSGKGIGGFGRTSFAKDATE